MSALASYGARLKNALGGRVEASMVACVALGGAVALLAGAVVRGLTLQQLGAAVLACAACAVVVALGASRAGARRRERMGALLGAVFELSGRNPDKGAEFVSGLAWGGEATDGVARLEAEIRSIGRAYRSLEVEREISQKLVASQEAERSAFFARLSYELRSPLNAIFGYTSLLLEEAERHSEKLFKADLLKIRSAGDELLSRIDTLLDLASARSEKIVEECVPFSLPEALDELACHFQSQSKTNQLRIGDSTAQLIVGNRRKVMRTITSLLDDAVRERNASNLVLNTRTMKERPGFLEVTLEAECEFNRRAGSGEMGGLGLQAAVALARSIGGSLEMDTVGETDFRYVLQFPADSEKIAERAPAKARAAKAALPETKKADGKVALVIDDDHAALELLSRWLQRGGYTVVGATSAEEGMELARREAPDIVLLDALMPGLNGYEVVPQMRALPALADTPILIISVDDDRPRGLRAGASDFIRKPVTEKQLHRLISVFECDQEGDVLIIDDDEDAAELLARSVKRLGFTPRKVRDGAEGLKILRKQSPRAILLDLNMPELNGFELIEQVSLDPELAKVPLIVVSGQDLSARQHKKLVSAGCRVYRKGACAPREIVAGLREAVA